MTIFGFNSNVHRDDVTYHVESQARESDLLLQTMIFLKGQCVGKRAYSYAAISLESGFSDESLHSLLKAQHKNLIEILERGPVESALTSSADVEDVGGAGLSLRWNNPGEVLREGQIALSLHLLDSGTAVRGAEVTLYAYPPAAGQALARAVTDAAGAVSLAATPGEDPAVIVRAVHGGKSATRKLRFRR